MGREGEMFLNAFVFVCHQLNSNAYLLKNAYLDF